MRTLIHEIEILVNHVNSALRAVNYLHYLNTTVLARTDDALRSRQFVMRHWQTRGEDLSLQLELSQHAFLHLDKVRASLESDHRLRHYERELWSHARLHHGGEGEDDDSDDSEATQKYEGDEERERQDHSDDSQATLPYG